MITVDVVTRREDLANLSQSWSALVCKDARDGMFRTFGWYRAWMEHIRPEAEPFVIVVRNESGAIVGLAPLCRGTYSDLGFRLRAVFSAGREVVSGDFLDLLSEPEARPQVTAAVLSFLERNRSDWALLVFGELVDGGHTYAAVSGMATQYALPLRRQEERICPYIELPASFDAYLGSLGSSTRYHIRRRMRDVEKKGGRVEVHTRPEEIAGRLDTLIQLHLARWRKENLPGTMSRPGFPAFLRQICAEPPENSGCRLYMLNLDGAPAAALMAFYFGESVLYYQAGWDPESGVSSLSPAVVLMAHSIRDAIAYGFRYYEFLRGDEAYKSRWTKTYRKTSTLLLARSFMAKEYLRVARLKDAAKQLLAPAEVPKPDPADCVESEA